MIKNPSQYKEVLDNLIEGVYFVDHERKITYWNKAAERISGFKAGEVIGKHCYDNFLNHIDDNNKQLCLDGCPLHKTILDGQQREAGVYLHHKDGHRVSVAVRTMPLLSEGKIVGASEVFIDDDKQALFNKRINALKAQALYDKLTQLPNRRYIDLYLRNRMKDFDELKMPFALLMADIDFFKKVNDRFGHDIGDRVLIMVSKTLKTAFRKSDLVGRWGGEEFLAILSNISESDLLAISEKVRTMVENSAIRDTENSIKVTVSIGATLVQKEDSINSILKRVDEALYASKDEGRNKTTLL